MFPRLILAPVLATIALLVLAPQVHAADFQAGWTAYQNGDFAKALAEWRPLADQGVARAQFNVGVLYDEGKGVAQDRDAAVGGKRQPRKATRWHNIIWRSFTLPATGSRKISSRPSHG